MKVAVFHNKDGNIVVRHQSRNGRATVVATDGVYTTDRPPILVYPGRGTPETEDEYIQRLAASALAQGKAVDTPVIMDESALPLRRELRDAWEMETDVVVVNRKKAEKIQLDLIRIARNAELYKADIEVNKAVDNEDAVAEATARKRRKELRDLPANFDMTVTDVERIADLWPEGLPKPE